jgi:hypothetical protein
MAARFVALLPVLLTATGCGCRRPCPAPDPTAGLRAASTPIVSIRRAEPGRALHLTGKDWEGWAIVGKEKEGGWGPSEQDVKRIEDALPAEAKKRVPDWKRPLSGYWRQYVGVTDEGKRIVRVHGAFQDATKHMDLDLSQDELEVMDGEDDFFEAEYDPATGTILSLGLHGGA